MSDQISVLIICGGQSPEHEISLRSARNVLEAIDRAKYQPIIVGINHLGGWVHLSGVPEGNEIVGGSPIKIDPASRSLLTENEISLHPKIVFPVLHGPNGEDGAIQGLLQILDIPYVGPNILGSSVAMDKGVAKTQLASAGLNVAAGLSVYKEDKLDLDEITNELGLPLFIKPANMGSSVGVHKVRNEQEFNAAMDDAFQFDTKVIIEEMLEGRELECAVLGLQGNLMVTSPGEVSSEEEYSFEEKYSDTSQTQLDIPAKNLDEETLTRLKETAIQAFKALNCEIMSRVDMFLTAEGKIYVNEINTIPGFTGISMYPKLWEYEGIPYQDLITKLLDLAVARHDRNKRLKRSRL